MKNLIFFLLLASCTIHAQEKLIMNDAGAILREPGNFTKLSVNGPFKVYFSEGKACALAVSAKSEAVRDHILTSVKDGTLIIGLDKSSVKWWGINQELKIYVSAPGLSEIKASGATDFVVVDLLRSSRLSVVLSGASDLSGRIASSSVNMVLSGASDCEISGEADVLKATLSGASSLKGKKFIAADASISASGASSARISVKNKLSAAASGASSIQYEGSPHAVHSSAQGMSTIRKVQ